VATLTITDAARVTGVSRMLLYRYIKSGKLSRTPEGLIDTAELLRAGLLLHYRDRESDVTPLHDVTPTPVTSETPVTPTVTSAVTSPGSTEIQTLERLIDVLQRELDAARERETLLLQMLSQMQQQNQRLLDMPRIPPESPQEAPGAPHAPRRPKSPPPPQRPPQAQPAAQAGDPRGAMHRRIVALLQEYPEGLTPREMRDLLGVERSLADTCLGMRRDGLISRLDRGRYSAS
jgi:AcrR family transcriptional regulator